MIRFEITAVDTVETLTDLAQLGRYAEKCLAAMKSTAQHPEEPYAVPAAGDAGLPSAPTDHAATSATAPAQEQSAPPAAETGEKPPRPEEVREKGLAAARKHGKDAVKSILKKFNVENMSSLKEADRIPFMKALDELEKAGGAVA